MAKTLDKVGWHVGMVARPKILRAQRRLNEILRGQLDGPRRLKDGRPIVVLEAPYVFLTTAPRRIGDQALLQSGKGELVLRGRKGRRHLHYLSPPIFNVILLEAEDGSRWLVKVS